MLGLIVRLLMVIAGSITSWFVSADALNFDVIQMVIAVLVFTIIIFVIAFWSNIVGWYRRIRGR